MHLYVGVLHLNTHECRKPNGAGGGQRQHTKKRFVLRRSPGTGKCSTWASLRPPPPPPVSLRHPPLVWYPLRPHLSPAEACTGITERLYFCICIRRRREKSADAKRVAKFARGDAVAMKRLTDKKLKGKLRYSEKLVREATASAAQADEWLLPAEAGGLEAEGMERTWRFKQDAIAQGERMSQPTACSGTNWDLHAPM